MTHGTYNVCTMHVHSKLNYVIAIHMYMYCIEKSVNISITRITRVNDICFFMLLLAMISLHMLTFRLMVTMVAEFCS